MVHNIGSRLNPAIIRRGEKAKYFCEAENISANQKIHELRRNFKRLRALLHFYNQTNNTTTGRLYKEIRQFGKQLAPLRESAVNIEIFNREIASNPLIPEKKIKAALELLQQKNRDLLNSDYINNNLCHTIENFFNLFHQHFKAGQIEDLSRYSFYEEISESYERGFNYFQNLSPLLQAEELHILRRRLKRLWYQFDFIRIVHPRFFKVKTDQLNNITNRLGNDYDLHIFIIAFEKERYGFSVEELQILKNQIEHLRTINRTKYFPRLKQFFTTTPYEFNQRLAALFMINV